MDFSYSDFTLTVATGTCQWETLEGFKPYLLYGTAEEPARVLFESAEVVLEEPYRSGVGEGIRLTLSGFEGPAEGLSFRLILWKEAVTDILRLEWIPLTEGKETPKAVYWPGPMSFEEGKSSWYTLINDEQGIRLPNNWPVPMEKAGFNGMLNTAGAYMPWFAQVKDGNALLVISETPWNMGYDIDHPENGPYTHMQMRMEPSLGKMEYRRIQQMRFLDQADHNTVCKEYRRYAKEKGTLRTLKEKQVANPSINDMVGVSFVHTGIKTMVQPDSRFFDPEAPEKNNHLTPFHVREQEMKDYYDAGVRKLYLHLDGWADPGYDNNHPDYSPACKAAGGWEGLKSLADTMKACGFMFGIHDQYRDYYRSAESFDENFACRLPDGSIPEHANWAGGPQSYLCGTQALYYVRRNFSQWDQQGIRLDGAYLDVFTCNEGDECDDPEHRMSRRDCYEARQSCFRFLLNKDILPSSEEVNDWAMATQVFCHYAPYNFQLAEPGAPKHGIPVPLFNLVYHDCVIEPWMMDQATEQEDYMLYALQNGGAPYLRRDPAYPNIDGAFAGAKQFTLEEQIERCQVVQQLHEKVAMEEMLAVDLADDLGRIQTVTFADGTMVRLDFDAQTYDILN